MQHYFDIMGLKLTIKSYFTAIMCFFLIHAQEVWILHFMRGGKYYENECT